jgi:hypothetical protein
MNFLKQVLTLLLVILAFDSQAQTLEFTKQITGPNTQAVNDIEIVTANKNYFVAGEAKGIIDFENGYNVDTLTVQNVGSYNGGFLSKYDSIGNPLWYFSIPSPGNGHVGVQEISIDQSENVFAGVRFVDNTDFDPSPTNTALLNTYFFGTQHFALAKYSAQGTYEWAFYMEGLYLWDIHNSSSGDVYVCGDIKSDTVDFDPDPIGTFPVYGYNGGMFLAKYDSQGNFLWANAMNGDLQSRARSVAVDQTGDVIIGGHFVHIQGGTQVMDLDPSANNAIFTSPAYSEFVAKYDSNGTYQWAGLIEQEYDNIISSINLTSVTTDSDDNILIAGQFSDTFDFDPTTGIDNQWGNVYPGFISKWDKNGDYKWTNTVGQDYARVWPTNIVCDAQNRVYLTGAFDAEIDLDNGPGVHLLNAPDIYDSFIAAYDSLGDYYWSHHIRTLNQSSRSHFLATDKEFRLMYSLSFFDTIQGDLASTSYTHTPDASSGNANFDIIIMSLSLCGDFESDFEIDSSIFHALVPSAQYQWVICTEAGYEIIGGANSSSFEPTFNGSYALVTTRGNCSDTSQCKEIDLCTNFESDFTNNSGLLIASVSSAQYQWILCTENGFEVIQNAIDSSFQPTASGTFALVTSNNACVDTSDCREIIVVGTDNLDEPMALAVLYPNPTKGALTIDFGTSDEYTISVFSVAGQLVFKKERITSDQYSVNLDLAPGSYIIKCDYDDKSWFSKVLILGD